jgi:hypothetical protein
MISAKGKGFNQRTDGRWQMADGRRQGAEDRGQQSGGRWQTTEGSLSGIALEKRRRKGSGLKFGSS